MVEVIADQVGKLLDARIVDRRWHLRQILTLAPIAQRVRMVKAGRSLPEIFVVQKGDHRPLKVVGQGQECFYQESALRRSLAQLPPRLVEYCEKPLLTA